MPLSLSKNRESCENGWVESLREGVGMVPEVIVVPIDKRAKLAGWGEQENQIRDWQIEEFLRQTGKAQNTQRVYRGQLQRFAAWSGKAWLEASLKGCCRAHLAVGGSRNKDLRE